jgi:16S rRNA (adenine1518-N6/adenine1519-N6)-dimethyltransferase
MDQISALFQEFSYRPRKSAGQNFLTDGKILDKIAAVIQCPPGDILLEVGGGYGVLTEKLVQKGHPLTVVEIDHKLFAMLERKYGTRSGMRLVKEDILKYDLATTAPPPPAKLTVAGNIPYYLTTPLITKILIQYHDIVRNVYLMVQKEVADRMVAHPGTKAYGALTLCAQYYSTVRKCLDVPAHCFKPAPKVDSAFIELVLKPELPLNGAGEKRLFALIRAIFQTRRKVITNSLKSLGQKPDIIGEALRKTGLDPMVRGETLGLEKLIELSKALSDVQGFKE